MRALTVAKFLLFTTIPLVHFYLSWWSSATRRLDPWALLWCGSSPCPEKVQAGRVEQATFLSKSEQRRNYAVATYAVGAQYCLHARALFDSIPEHQRDLIDRILLTPDVSNKDQEPHPNCKALLASGNAIVVRVPEFPITASVNAKANYRVSFNKLWVFNLTQYDRVVFADADSFFTSRFDLNYLLEKYRAYQLTMSLEQGEGKCGEALLRRNAMNAGFFLLTPAPGLFDMVVDRLSRPGCLTPEWKYCDQELLVCLSQKESLINSTTIPPEEATSDIGIATCHRPFEERTMHVHFVSDKRKYYNILMGKEKASPSSWPQLEYARLGPL